MTEQASTAPFRAPGQEWLTYAQIGLRFGISPEAARQRARRLSWRTQPGNDGRTLVLVPIEAVAPSPVHRADKAAGQTGETARLIALLTTAEARTERAEQRADATEAARLQAEARADAATARADAAEGRAHRAEDRAAELRDRMEAVEAQAAVRIETAEQTTEQARREAAEAEYAAEALRRADDARKARGRWARLRAAWRGD